MNVCGYCGNQEAPYKCQCSPKCTLWYCERCHLRFGKNPARILKSDNATTNEGTDK